jgi:GAF domain-containing protein
MAGDIHFWKLIDASGSSSQRRHFDIRQNACRFRARCRIFIRQGFQSYLGLPLIAKDKVVGILSFYASEERQYSDEEPRYSKR